MGVVLEGVEGAGEYRRAVVAGLEVGRSGTAVSGTDRRRWERCASGLMGTEFGCVAVKLDCADALSKLSYGGGCPAIACLAGRAAKC